MSWANTKAIWDNLKPGETVLIEHSSRVEPTLLFHDLLKWANEKGYPVVIDDFLDTLYAYKIHMKLAGLDWKILDDVKVIKMGGAYTLDRSLRGWSSRSRQFGCANIKVSQNP